MRVGVSHEENRVTWTILAFAFATLGSKVLLGLWIVWVFLPTEPECSRCNGFTTLLEPRRGLRTFYRMCRIRHRWCPGCGEDFLARGGHPPRVYVGEPLPDREPSPVVPQVLARRSQ